MTSETRANWIFLGIFLLLMGPGLIILSAKAYKKGAAGMNPPAPQSVAAYNNPNPQNPVLPRVVPPQTASLVESIAYRLQKLQPELKRVHRADGTPVLSEKRQLECIALGRGPQHLYAAIIGWDRTFAPLPSLYRFIGTQSGKSLDLKMAAYEQTNMPLEVRDELQKYGYIRPPDSFIWIILEAPNVDSLDEIQLRYEIDRKVSEDRLMLRNMEIPSTTQHAESPHP